MANDIVLTEEEQAERLKAWWKDNGTSIVVGAAIGISAIAGYNYWQDQRNQTMEQASSEYMRLLEAIRTPDSVKAHELGASILNEYGDTVYGAKAALIQAKLQADSGELDEALESLILAKDSTNEPGLAHVANLRMARIYLEQGEFQQAQATVAVAANARTGFESQYIELEGDIAFAQGDTSMARQKYIEALASLGSDLTYAGVLQLKVEGLGSIGVVESDSNGTQK